MGAGILPIATTQCGNIYFLFGEERYKVHETASGWADFGGGRNNNESDKNMAIREFTEETSGFFGDKSDARKLMNKSKLTIQTNDHKYTTFTVPIMYDEKLPIYFNNQVRFLKEYMDESTLNKSTMHEKQEMKWFTFDQLREDKNKFRPFYQEIIDKILERETDIVKLYGNKNKKRKRNIKRSNNPEKNSEE